MSRPLTRRSSNSRRRASNTAALRQRCRRLRMEPLETRAMLTGTWTQLANLLPSGTPTPRLALLPDGSVMIAGYSSGQGTSERLTPDANGGYVNGTWSPLPIFSTGRGSGSETMFPDGRLLVLGGIDGSVYKNTGEIYNPTTNSWTNISPFPESTFGNGPTMLLADGRLLAGSITGPRTYFYNETTDTWTIGPTKRDNDSSLHETWTLLPDGSVLSYDVNANQGHAQRFDPTTNSWIDSGTVPVSLEAGVSAYLNMGPGVLLPDGRVLQLGRSSNTAIYTPSTTPGGTGTWAAGPIIPNGLEAGGSDAYNSSSAAVMANGHVMFTVDTPDSGGPTKIYEFDPAAPLSTSLTDITPPISTLQTTSVLNMPLLDLPNGQVLLLYGQTSLFVYTPSGAPQAAWKPTISSIVSSGDHYTLTGTQLNGLSAGGSHGDNTSQSSNYPIVELTSGTGKVYFARTSNWSSTGVATGSKAVTTDFSLPIYVGPGTYSLSVVANGIASSGFVFSYTPQFTSADLAVTSTAPATVTVGNNITYNLTVTNNGFTDASNVVLTDPLGANLQFVSATSSQDSFIQSGGTVTFSLGSIPVGGRVTATITAQALAAGTLTNTASATSDIFDADLGNNSATVTASVIQSTGIPLANTFVLHSDPGAHQVIYLDFNGNTGPEWGNSTDPIITTPAYDFDGNPSSFGDEELARIQRIWQRVTEDFLPFNVDVTTQDPGTAALMKSSSSDIDYGVRVVIGGDGAWAGGGGVATIGSFTAATDTPCYVFPDAFTTLPHADEKETAEAISHEVGHTLGLSHDGLTNPVEEYYGGSGSGPTGWAPIMGTGYSENLTQWSKGEYLNANNTQDDLAIITSQNGFGYRVDDYGNTPATASPLTATSPTTFTGAGIIEQNTDTDVFSFSTTGGNYGITINPAVRGPDLDILAKLYNATGTLIATSNPVDTLSAGFQVTVAGLYYLSVTGTGKGDPLNGGYSNYASLGQYSINVAPNTAPVAALSGPVSGTEDASISFDASGSYDPDGNALSYHWDFGDGTTASSSTPTISHRYQWGGTFPVSMSVDDGQGGTSSATTSAAIGEVNDTPLASAGGPYAGFKGVAVAFNASASSDFDNLDGSSTNNQTLTYSWNFGDGTTGTGKTPSHTYATAGNYSASLTVSDGIASNSAVTSVNIAAPSANDMYVWDIAAATTTKGRNSTTSISVVVHRDSNTNGLADSNDALVQSATITVELRNSSGTLIGTVSGTTSKQGVVSGSFSNLANGTYVAEVTVLSHSTYTWNKLFDPTPNDTDLDGDNLPDQQFAVGTAAAKGALAAASESGESNIANGQTGVSQTDWSPVPTVSNSSSQLKSNLIDQLLAADFESRGSRGLAKRLAAASEDVLDNLFATE